MWFSRSSCALSAGGRGSRWERLLRSPEVLYYAATRAATIREAATRDRGFMVG